MKRLLLFALLALALSTVNAQLIISEDTTWGTDQILTQSVIVEEGATLTIAGGVHVTPIFLDVNNDQIGDISIVINGVLDLQGDVCNRVVFEPYEETSDLHFWEGLYINSVAANNELKHFNLEYSHVGLQIQSEAIIVNAVITNCPVGITTQAGSLTTIENSWVYGNEGTGVLLLGGTTEAFRLAQMFANEPGIDIITALAGRTSSPRRPAGRLRIGGFGGAEGLAEFIVNQRINAVIDATHPFASTISFNALQAAKMVSVPHLLLSRSSWNKKQGDMWVEVPDIAAAVSQIPKRSRVMLAVGRQEAAAFAVRQDCWFLTRMMEQPEGPIPPGDVILGRPGDSPDEECALMSDNRINCVVAKNSGGPGYAKIEAANWMGITVVLVSQPQTPPCDRVSVVGDAAVWLRRLFSL